MPKRYGGAILGLVLAAVLTAATPATAKVEMEYEFKDGPRTMAVGAYTGDGVKIGLITFSAGGRDLLFGLTVEPWLRLRTLFDTAAGYDGPSSPSGPWRQVGEVQGAPAPSRLTLFAGPGGHVRFVLHGPNNEEVSVEMGERDAVLFGAVATSVKHYLLSRECPDLSTCEKASK